MAAIYRITNCVNGKIYVGKTAGTIEKRFAEHLRTARRDLVENRPLYRAMRKYGAERFCVDLIETCADSESAARERYWIERLGSRKNGYNATCGGDGKYLYDHDAILLRLKEAPHPTKVAREFGCCADIVRDIAAINGVAVENAGKYNLPLPKKVLQISVSGEILNEFESAAAAARWCRDNGRCQGKISRARVHISECARNERRTAYGYRWKYSTLL